MAEMLSAINGDDSAATQSISTPQERGIEESQKKQQQTVSCVARKSNIRSGSISKRLCLNGEERLFVHRMLLDTEFWGCPRQQQVKLFETMAEKVKTDIEAPFRDTSRRNFTIDYVRSLIKNMPRFVTEKRKKYKSKLTEATADGVEPSEEEFQESLTKAEQLELKTLKLSETMVEKMSSNLSSSDDTVEAVQASAAQSRKRRNERRVNSQKQYAARKKQARKLEAANENRIRLAEHRTEKLLTASVNDGRHMGQLLGALVKVVGMQAGVSENAISNMMGNAADPLPSLIEPPEPDLIVISSEEDSCPEDADGESGDNLDMVNQAEEEEEQEIMDDS